MGIALWIVGGLVSFALARFIPAGRRRSWLGELVTSILAAALLGVAATALDFGGWREPDWRPGLFAFFGALAAVGVFRLVSVKMEVVKPLALALPIVLFFSTCTAYKAQHAAPEAKSSQPEPAARAVKLDPAVVATFDAQPIATKQALLLSQIDSYREELKASGKYDCCVKPACRQCALSAGECHCRQVIDANGPCCGECTQSWVEGRGNTAGVDREKVLEHLGCVRELYEKKVPEGVTPPAQTKKQ